MEPIDYLKVIRLRWRIIAAVLLVAVVAAWLTAPAGRSVRAVDSFKATHTLVFDPNNQRYLVVGPDAKPAGTFTLGDATGLRAVGRRVKGVDAQGRLYYQGSSIPASNGGDALPREALDSVAIVRWDRKSGRHDTLGMINALRILQEGGAQPPACYADCDESGELDFFDFLCFQNLFAAMDPAADCDGDGAFPFFDFLCFQNAFAAGCE